MKRIRIVAAGPAVSRRAVVVGLLALMRPHVAAAQSGGRVIRIGRLSPLSAATDAPNLDAFRRGLRELGWVDGRTFTIEARFADGKAERLPALAAELVRQRVDVILVGSNQGAVAARGATTTIPIVMVTTGDPVAAGIVASLARPGGNLTGVTALGQALNAKRLELLKEAVPGVRRVIVLVNPGSLYTAPLLRERESIARALGLELHVAEVRDAARLDQAFAAMAGERAGALMVQTDVMFVTHRTRIVELAARSRLPAVYGEREFVDAGGLMFYGASLVDMYHRAAVYADRILKGAQPGDLPVEQPTKLELVINRKAARALGLTLPPALLARADHLIE
jgi:putative ABC transport system substrate-binding protein